MIDDHPLPWLTPLLNGVEHANFFETRATEYSKGATKGNWQDVWATFDKRRKAKANDTGDEAGDEGPDMFAANGIAAE
jgi:ribonucleoside-diphosphate reductase beta chain